MILTHSLRILTLTLIKFSFFFLCFFVGTYRDCFHDFSFSLRFLEVSHVETRHSQPLFATRICFLFCNQLAFVGAHARKIRPSGTRA
jgi:hypothetical protein